MNENEEQNDQHQLGDFDLREEQVEGVRGGVAVEVSRRPGPGPGPVLVPIPYPNQNTRK
jgi:hypothetical protein